MSGPQDFQVVSLCVEHPDCIKSGKLFYWINLSKLTKMHTVCPKCGSRVVYFSRVELIKKLSEALNGVSTEQLLIRAMRDAISITTTNGIRIEMAEVQHILDTKFVEQQKAAVSEFVNGLRGVLSASTF